MHKLGSFVLPPVNDRQGVLLTPRTPKPKEIWLQQLLSSPELMELLSALQKESHTPSSWDRVARERESPSGLRPQQGQGSPVCVRGRR